MTESKIELTEPLRREDAGRSRSAGRSGDKSAWFSLSHRPRSRECAGHCLASRQMVLFRRVSPQPYVFRDRTPVDVAEAPIS